MIRASHVLPIAAFALLSQASGGCVTAPDPGATTYVLAPDFSGFAGDASNPGVQAFLERRCASLDCHGQPGRPLRLYSAGGLRMPNDAGLVSGGGPDTPAELRANYEAVIGLQPEQTSLVVAHVLPPTELLVVAKPLGRQTHKGGQVLATGDSGDACLESWLVGQISLAECAAAAQVP